MGRFLQAFRRLFSGALFLLLLFYVSGGISHLYGFDPSVLSRIQLVPALLAGSFGVVACIAFFTVIFGRWYCSFLCPLGIWQDILARLRKKKFTKIRKVTGLIRYCILVLCIASVIGGASLVLLLVDPWSVFGRLTTTFVLPVVTFINNLLASAFNYFGLYGVVAKKYNFAGISVFTIAVISLAFLGYFIFFSGPRFWCTTLCPVGTVLSWLAKKSLVRVQIDQQKCVSCGLCEKHCKTGVITLKTKQVDNGDCVACFNCLPVCQYDAISYGFSGKGKST